MEHATHSAPYSLAQKQLHIFSMPSGRGNTLLDYDLLPRFFHDRAQKKVLLDSATQHKPRVITLAPGERYEIVPAILNLPGEDGDLNEDGTPRLYPYAVYPGTRESLIEDCLIYFARHGEFSIEKGTPGYRYDSGVLGVCFTLYQLRMALKDQGKEYRLDELKEGLEVLAMAKYRYTNEAERDRLCGYIVAELDSIPNPCPNDRIRCDRIVYVQFDVRASKRILAGHYRSYDDRIALSMKSPISRYLYKQFTHSWQNANLNSEGGSQRAIEQNETILASGCPLSSNPTKRKDGVLKALAELHACGIIQAVDEHVDVVPVKEGRKIVDLTFMIRPTSRFITQQIEGFRRLQDSRRVGEQLQSASAHPQIGAPSAG